MTDILAVIDNIAVLNGGPVTLNGYSYIAIRREDWEALLALRGDPEAVLARMAPIVEPPEPMSRAEAGQRLEEACRLVGL